MFTIKKNTQMLRFLLCALAVMLGSAIPSGCKSLGPVLEKLPKLPKFPSEPAATQLVLDLAVYGEIKSDTHKEKFSYTAQRNGSYRLIVGNLNNEKEAGSHIIGRVDIHTPLEKITINPIKAGQRFTSRSFYLKRGESAQFVVNAYHSLFVYDSAKFSIKVVESN